VLFKMLLRSPFFVSLNVTTSNRARGRKQNGDIPVMYVQLREGEGRNGEGSR
jgi:hypothetical protein